jgi:hypothetical protein
MIHLNWQPVQNPHNRTIEATLIALGKAAGSAVAAYITDAVAVPVALSLAPSQWFRDWHVGVVGLPTSTGLNGWIPTSAMDAGMRQTQVDTRFHVHYKDRDEAQGDC